MTASQTTSASYEVGYRKPPRHTQFQKGQSGNPGGRPRRSLPARLDELALDEAYRTTIVVEDGIARPMPVIKAILRRQLQSAAGGNVRAQRDVLAMIRDIERAQSLAALLEDDDDDDVVDDDDADANDGDDNDADDTADADRDDAGGADDDEPGRQQADGIDAYGERPQAERERTAPPAVSAPQPENAAAPPAGGAKPRKADNGEAFRPAATAPNGARDVQPARPQPGRRRRGPAVNAGKIRGGRPGSPRSPGRTKSGRGPARAVGGHARAPATRPERDEN